MKRAELDALGLSTRISLIKATRIAAIVGITTEMISQNVLAAAIGFITAFATDFFLRPYFARSGAKHFNKS